MNYIRPGVGEIGPRSPREPLWSLAQEVPEHLAPLKSLLFRLLSWPSAAYYDAASILEVAKMAAPEGVDKVRPEEVTVPNLVVCVENSYSLPKHIHLYELKKNSGDGTWRLRAAPEWNTAPNASTGESSGSRER